MKATSLKISMAALIAMFLILMTFILVAWTDSKKRNDEFIEKIIHKTESQAFN